MSIEVERHGKTVLFRLNRPEVLNAIDVDTSLELAGLLREFNDDPDRWVAVITGTGDRAFSAGADLKSTPTRGDSRLPPDVQPILFGVTKGVRIWKPLIAAVNGLALGGGLELALGCDLRLAVPTAEFGLPEARWNLIPGAGGLARLPRAIPLAKAMEVTLTPRRLSAEDALRYGLINAIVPPERLIPEALTWAEGICQMGPVAVRRAKEAMIRGMSMNLEDALQLENYLSATLRDSEDTVEGRRAFAEKRTPNFRGR